QEFFVGMTLNLDQVRHFADFGNLAEAAADAFSACKAFAVGEGTDGFLCAHVICARMCLRCDINRGETPMLKTGYQFNRITDLLNLVSASAGIFSSDTF